MAENTRNLTEGSVTRAILVVSAPMTLGIFSVLSVGIADAYFLGQIGQTELAAVGYIFPVITAITSLSIGLAAGANAAISQALGRGEDDAVVRRKALHALGLGGLLSVIVAALVYLAQDLIFGAMGASDQVLEEIGLYMRWWVLSYPFLVTVMIANAAFRAHGDGMTAALLMTLSAVLNIGLDPLLIFGAGPVPGLGTEGAGLATFLARVAAFAIAIPWALRQGMLGACGNYMKDWMGSVRQVLHVGLPASMSNAVNPAGMALVTAAVATLGDAAVAGFGAATRVQQLALVALLALSSGIGPVIGQNWGAEKHDRARAAMRRTFAMCLGYGLTVGVLLFIFADPLGQLIADGGEASDYTAQYLRIVGWSLFGYGILITANAALNARDKAVWSMSLSLGRIGLVYVPAAWLGVTMLGFTGILLAAVAANVLAAWAAIVACRATGLLATDATVAKAPADAIKKVVAS